MCSAGILLALDAPMAGIVKPDGKSLDSFASFFNCDQHSSAAVSQSIESVHIVDKDYLSSDFQFEHSLKGGVLDAASVVGLECLDSSACIFGLDGEQFTVDLFQLAGVSGVHLGIGAVNVESILEDGVVPWPDSCLQQRNVLLRVSPYSNPVQ